MKLSKVELGIIILIVVNLTTVFWGFYFRDIALNAFNMGRKSITLDDVCLKNGARGSINGKRFICCVDR